MDERRADVIPPCPICGFEMKWWFAKWKCFNCGQWNGCCGDDTGDPGGLWCESDEINTKSSSSSKRDSHTQHELPEDNKQENHNDEDHGHSVNRK